MHLNSLPESLRGDLHCHSTASDGALTPAEVVQRAQAEGVGVLALTDHDTIAGLEQARAAAREAGMVLVSGIELSCLWRGQTIHVVGLDFAPDCPQLIKVIEAQENVRRTRAATIDERLSQKGLPSLLEAASALAAGVPGRPHFAQAMVERGLVDRPQAAFKRYLGTGKAGDVKACWPELQEVVDWINAAQGLAVLAHPRKYGLTNTKLKALIADFVSAGGRGLEVLSSGQSPQDTAYLARLCSDYGCVGSGGSDFHAPGRPWCELGKLPSMPPTVRPIWDHFSDGTRAAMTATG